MNTPDPEDEDRAARDRRLDEALEESFPASDAPAITVDTAMPLPADPRSSAVTDHREARRFELVVDGQTSVLVYKRTPEALVLMHTEVPPAQRGHHLGDALAKAAIDSARADHLQVVAVCPFVKAYLRKHAG